MLLKRSPVFQRHARAEILFFYRWELIMFPKPKISFYQIRFISVVLGNKRLLIFFFDTTAASTTFYRIFHICNRLSRHTPFQKVNACFRFFCMKHRTFSKIKLYYIYVGRFLLKNQNSGNFCFTDNTTVSCKRRGLTWKGIVEKILLMTWSTF